MFKNQLNVEDTRYFIIDTHGGKNNKNNYDDRDFIRYVWELARFGKVRKNDLFVYRRPSKNSELKEFYFFGAGKFGEIELIDTSKKKPVLSNIHEYIKFDSLVIASNEKLLEYEWVFKKKSKKNWEHFFNQYGMTQICKEDFLFLVSLGVENEKTCVRDSFDNIEKGDVIGESETIYIDKEGKKKLVYGYKYERNPKLREEALRIHGYKCCACNFDFENFYGEIGKDFIEVHHIKPLSEIKEEQVINPKYDLLPLCSNCHRMIHRSQKSVLTVESLKEIIERKE